MEDADSDSGFDSDGDWYHAGRDIVHGLRTNSNAVGPDGAHRRRFLCGEEKKGGTRWGCLSFASGTVPCGHSVPGTACTAEPTLLCTFYRMLRMTPKLTPVKRLI